MNSKQAAVAVVTAVAAVTAVSVAVAASAAAATVVGALAGTVIAETLCKLTL